MSSLQHKLTNYEVVPPPGVWDKVAAALDESSIENEFPSRLYNLQVSPPANAWTTISSTLHDDDTANLPAETKVIPLKRRTPAFIRYAVAAVLIGAVAVGIIKFTTASPGIKQEELAETANSNKAEKKTIPVVTPQKNDGNEVKNNDLPVIEKTGAPYTRTEQIAKINLRKNNARTAVQASYASDESFNDQYTNPIYAYDNIAPNIADRYIMLMTPEGNFIRMSKKLSNLVCCVSGEEQDEDCKSQLKKWQEKIADSPFATSPGNFLDILSLVGSLDEL